MADYKFVKNLEKKGKWLSKLWPVCAQCGGKLSKMAIPLPRHTARELLESGLLDGGSERIFHSTRDDLGWHVGGLACQRCKLFAPQELHHTSYTRSG